MNKIKLGENQGFIEINLEDITDWQNQGTVSIQSGNYYVMNAEIWITIDELITLYTQLQEAYKTLKGNIIFSNLDNTLQFTLQFNSFGQISLEGKFQEFPSRENKLEFEFMIDQSHLPATLLDMKKIVKPYIELQSKG
ncbi:hypothetical protein FH508_0011005 [Lysinibacillus sp. CD3-6]|uniref:WapI family immunity protein n=1 Tax=Lysinibacillus sp. CD3-6 TaxID=2892541 RepID=UPI00116CD8E5|nr:hypothetical protein [Lysinibacillus sp. CD3-6]UED82397.1 hypothetical protein FH508_0011005 [Lysinibacillus sp. CD3-6]